MKAPLTVRELNKLLEGCGQDSVVVMMVGDELKYIYAVDEDEAVGNPDIHLLSSYSSYSEMGDDLLVDGIDYLDFYAVSVLK